ncbi:MAG: cob(I)yrinic acid a,c-diamide adenosyltransferase [Gammaproteobacteria bacterium]|nr:cob(I)yrinic acid a,c-diamide adenosyltransferase [Gammaproteobacteria bacterium]NND53713.1 cob(I)yrinic acid a,c-diamide adenosyltransferase [Gammaproteobacteria bacterium]
MGNRLSKIYTRTGDDGTTGLGDGSRAPKDHVRVEAYGTIDELNSAIGVLIACDIEEAIAELLTDLQHRLFDLGGELCIPGSVAITAEHVAEVEAQLDDYNADLPPLKDFILPGGTPAGAACHMARAICRRAERRLCTLADAEDINPQAVHFVNRVSDLLFVLARVINNSAGDNEILWNSDRLNR